MRAAAGLALLLTACSSHASGPPAGEGANVIDCAVGGAVSFSHVCSVERSRQNGAALLIVRHPDGGFRRFKILDGGQSLTTADGADALAFARSGNRMDVNVNGDRYRLPAAMLNDDRGH